MTWPKELIQAALDSGLVAGTNSNGEIILDCNYNTIKCVNCILVNLQGICTYKKDEDLSSIVIEHFPEALI